MDDCPCPCHILDPAHECTLCLSEDCEDTDDEAE